MSIFNIFNGKNNFMDGIEQWKNTVHAVLLDVRSEEEYKMGHIPKSKNLPLHEISNISYDKEVPLFVYCQSGARSKQACQWLKKQGYQNVINIGGINHYQGNLQR